MFGVKCISSQIFTFRFGLFLLLNVIGIRAFTSADSWLMFARETKKILGKCYLNVGKIEISKCFLNRKWWKYECIKLN